jgi:O-antigen/teichoic acid export membrane protein
MSGIKGIAKNLAANFGSHLVAVLQQVALTPLFIHKYGAVGLGEWITLSSAVSALGTLDFGIQTFVNQDLAMRFHRGDMEGLHIQQSTALRMLLGIVTVVGLLSLTALVMPIERWLRMDGGGYGPALSAHEVRSTVLVLAFTTLTGIVFGFFTGQFLVLNRAHVGQYWASAKNAAMILFAIPCLLLHTSFVVLALAQWAGMLVCLAGTLITLFRTGREIFPTLRYWDGKSVPRILGNSGYFGLIYASTLLCYQVPVVILARYVGPVEVAVFATTRTIFSMTRNVLNAFTQAIGPEVTTLYARQDWPQLSRLYDYSERAVFALIPVANVGALLLGPLLAHLWLHDPGMFRPGVFALSAAVSIVMSAKEHKFQFQFSTNTHQELSRFMFGTYAALAVAWYFVVPRFGTDGVLAAWLLAEIVQVLYIMGLNHKFFAHHQVLEVKYPVRLALLSVAALAATLEILPHSELLPLLVQAAVAIAAGFVLLGLDVPIFGLVPVWGKLRGILQRRMARVA